MRRPAAAAPLHPRRQTGKSLCEASLRIGAILLGSLAFVAGCGGSDDGVAKATLTDDGCSYSGARTFSHGLINIEAQNATLHFARFAIYEVASEVSMEDVRRFYERSRIAHDHGMEPGPPTYGDLYTRVIARSATDPEASSVLPLNRSSGRFVIVCFEDSSADTRQSSQDALFPAAVYVPAEVEVH